jgi:hypothetical protein
VAALLRIDERATGVFYLFDLRLLLPMLNLSLLLLERQDGSDVHLFFSEQQIGGSKLSVKGILGDMTCTLV